MEPTTLVKETLSTIDVAMKRGGKNICTAF